MDWTWSFDEWVPGFMAFGALGGALATFVLSFALGVWLLARSAGNPAWARPPRGLRWLGSPVGRAAGAALVLLVWDGLYLSSELLMLGILVGLAAQLLLAVVAGIARRRPAVWAHLAAAGLWFVVGFGVASFSRFNLRLAEARSHTVIAACRQFERDYGRLPVELEDLVPGYLPRLPRADWTFAGDFRYVADGRVALSYFSPWPQVRIYTFDDDKWWWNRVLGGFSRDDDEVRAAAQADEGDMKLVFSGPGLIHGYASSHRAPGTLATDLVAMPFLVGRRSPAREVRCRGDSHLRHSTLVTSGCDQRHTACFRACRPRTDVAGSRGLLSIARRR